MIDSLINPSEWKFKYSPKEEAKGRPNQEMFTTLVAKYATLISGTF